METIIIIGHLEYSSKDYEIQIDWNNYNDPRYPHEPTIVIYDKDKRDVIIDNRKNPFLFTLVFK